MKALVLAGGAGKRLLPYTTVLPKPLFPVGDRPIIDLLLRQLDRDGFDDVTISLGHLGELIEAYFATRPPAPRLHVRYVHEDQQLGTAGPLALAASADDTVLVVNGDVLTDLCFADVAAQHERADPAMTVTVQRRAVPVSFGVVDAADDGHIVAIREKPTIDLDCCIGVNVYGPEAIAIATRGGAVDFPDVVAALIGGGSTVDTFRFDGRWRDLGRSDDLLAAQAEIGAAAGAYLADDAG